MHVNAWSTSEARRPPGGLTAKKCRSVSHVGRGKSAAAWNHAPVCRTTNSIYNLHLGGDPPELGDGRRCDAAAAQGHTAQVLHPLEDLQSRIADLGVLEVQPPDLG